MDHDDGLARALIEVVQADAIAVEEVPPSETHMYGIVSVGADHGHTFEINGMVEKPPQGTAPSNLIISGRYILGPEIFPILANIGKGAGGEIQLTDGMKKLAETQGCYGVRFDVKTYDTGSKIGFLAGAKDLAAKLAAGTLPPEKAAVAGKLIFNQRLDALLAAAFLCILWLVVADVLWTLLQRCRGAKLAPSKESPYEPSKLERRP